ncbi:MAG TPA: hypothetical protein ENH85_11560 [Candidatus Scalindua sp.]|nr:hypothetical protein [Candidatus Scalindua sp.]
MSKKKIGYCKNCEGLNFHNWKSNAFHLSFPNGNAISTTWDGGSYSDNYDKWLRADFIKDKEGKLNDMPSKNVEIMFSCPDKLAKRIEKKYNDGEPQPIGYLSVEKWLEIVNLLAKETEKLKKDES